MPNLQTFRPQAPGQIQRITRRRFKVAANVIVTKGRPAVFDGGYVREAAAGVATLSKLKGRFTDTVDNTGGAAGALLVQVDLYHEIQVAWLTNDTGGTPVAQTDVGGVCYWNGPLAVTGTALGNSEAGEVVALTNDGAYVAVKLEA